MSDPNAELRPALTAALEADAGVIAAFGSNSVLVFDIPPENQAEPYLVVQRLDVDADAADCVDAKIVDAQVDIWSLTEIRGLAEADAIAAAVVDCIEGLAGDALTSWRIVTAAHRTTQTLTEASVRAHVIVTCQLSLDPLV